MYKRDIKDFTIRELKEDMVKISEPSYRASQIFYWLYKRGLCDFAGMKNIPIMSRNNLGQFYYIGAIKLKEGVKSADKTEKFLFELSDGEFIESVLIYSGRRNTLCLSTQVGCIYACAFCASGLKGFVRNLRPSEILSQILQVQDIIRQKITNFVFMGMGEPFDNYENLSKAINIMNSREGLDIGARRITVSTCGIIPGIERFKNIGIQAHLSVSLHAADNNLRNSLMSVNRIYPLEKLIAACEDFIKRTGRRITLEYVLLKDKNDSLKDARGLAVIAKRLKAKVNIIPYSPVAGKKFSAPSKRDTDEFKAVLMESSINVTVRESKGKDIEAACGQLAMKRPCKTIEEHGKV